MAEMQRFIKRARHLRRHQTSAEALLWQALRNRKLARWKFGRQHPIDRFTVDFLLLYSKHVNYLD
jgi:very-short-patch-repair endonuclease